MDNWYNMFRSIVSETEVTEDHLEPKDGEEYDDSGSEGSGKDVTEDWKDKVVKGATGALAASAIGLGGMAAIDTHNNEVTINGTEYVHQAKPSGMEFDKKLVKLDNGQFALLWHETINVPISSGKTVTEIPNTISAMTWCDSHGNPLPMAQNKVDYSHKYNADYKEPSYKITQVVGEAMNEGWMDKFKNLFGKSDKQQDLDDATAGLDRWRNEHNDELDKMHAAQQKYYDDEVIGRKTENFLKDLISKRGLKGAQQFLRSMADEGNTEAKNMLGMVLRMAEKQGGYNESILNDLSTVTESTESRLWREYKGFNPSK